MAKVVCALTAACKSEAGDFIIPADVGEWRWDDVHGSLGDVVAGVVPGRENSEEITLFKSVGLAIQDVSTALHVYKRAVELGVGMDFEF
jgi:ornithine cyclodeaminase